MGAAAGNKAVDLERRILTEPHSFTLFQTIRLLGILNAESREDIDEFIRRNVKVVPWLSLAFPPAEVVSVKKETVNGRPFYTVTAAQFGLYSTMGALPTFYTEELLDEAQEDESISREFLDILNNHLYHLLYAASRHGNLERRTVESSDRSAEFVQFCLMGQADEALRDGGIPALEIADLFVQRSRSAIRLERYIEFILRCVGIDAEVGVEQCVPRRAEIPVSQRCRVGLGGCRLGEDAITGSEVFDCTGKFRIHLKNVKLADVPRFLPGRPGYFSFFSRVRGYLDSPQDFDLVLHPADETPSPAPLGAGARLGFYLGKEAAQDVRIAKK